MYLAFITLVLSLICSNSFASVAISGANVSGVTKFNRYSSYETSQGTLVEGFEDIAQWTTSGTGVGISQNAGYSFNTVRESEKSISLTSSGSGTVEMVKDIGSAQDYSSSANFLIWLNPTTQTTITTINIYFSSVSNFASNFKYSIPQAGSTYNSLWPRWNRVLMPKDSFVNTGAEVWTTIRYIKIEVIATDASTLNVDGLYRGYTLDKPKLIIFFDDGLAGVINYAYPKMLANNQRGVAVINLSNIDTVSGMTYANLDTLYAAGWDVSNHNGPAADTHTQAEVAEYINEGYETLFTHGYVNSAKFYAFPSGQWLYPSYEMFDTLKVQHVFARGVNQVTPYQALPIMNENDPYADGQFYLGSGQFLNGFSTTASEVCGWIDNSIAAGGLYIITFHDIKEGSIFTAFQWLNTKFDDFSDCIKTKVDAGTLEVITLTDLYNSYLR